MTEPIPEPVLDAVRESLAAFRAGREVLDGREHVGASYRKRRKQQEAEREADIRIRIASARLRRAIREAA